MSKTNLQDFRNFIAQQWLAGVNPFSRELVDTGESYRGNPVFILTQYFGDFCWRLQVYRFTPTFSQHTVLAFVPED